MSPWGWERLAAHAHQPPVCDAPGGGLCSPGACEDVPALPAAKAQVEPPEGACGAVAGQPEGVSQQEQTDSAENTPTEIIQFHV